MVAALSQAQLRRFKAKVWRYFRDHGRTLPWRAAQDPYAILVSEIMLQQTQVDRVIPKYEHFLRQFPTPQALAQASLHTVLQAWQGLGYNRRARLLQQAARQIDAQHGGAIPTDVVLLNQLPGIGPYTARAIATFAFNQPHVLIETNIRAVYIHEFFPRARQVPDQALLSLIEATLSQRRSREWYWALMDYGSFLKKKFFNPSRRSTHHARQAPFKDSDRAIRGAIIKTLITTPLLTQSKIYKAVPFALTRVQQNLEKLTAEKMISLANKKYRIA